MNANALTQRSHVCVHVRSYFAHTSHDHRVRLWLPDVIYFSVHFGIQLQTFLVVVLISWYIAFGADNVVLLNDYYCKQTSNYNAVNLLVDFAIVSHSFDVCLAAIFVSFRISLASLKCWWLLWWCCWSIDLSYILQLPKWIELLCKRSNSDY